MLSQIVRRAGLPVVLIAAFAAGAATSGTAFGMQMYMHSAKTALVDALGDLQAASPDKGGHRLRAISDVRAAINEVNAGMMYGRM